MTTVIETDFKRDDLNALSSYIEKEDDAQVVDRTGQPMDGEDKQRLIDRSENEEMSRHIIISPENAENLDREGLRKVGTRTMRDQFGQDVDYGVTVHEQGGDRPHIHVAATGRADGPDDPLWIDRDDIENMRDRAHQHAQKQERGTDRALDDALDQEASQDLGQDLDADLGRGRDL